MASLETLEMGQALVTCRDSRQGLEEANAWCSVQPPEAEADA